MIALSRKKTMTFLMNLLCATTRTNPPLPLTFLHFPFLPALSFLPFYLTSLSSPSFFLTSPLLPSLPITHSTFPLSLSPFLSMSCTHPHFPSSSIPHLPATQCLSFFLSHLSSLSFPSSPPPLLLFFPPHPSLSLSIFPPCPPLYFSPSFCPLIPLLCALHHTPSRCISPLSIPTPSLSPLLCPPSYSLTMHLSSLHYHSLPVSSLVSFIIHPNTASSHFLFHSFCFSSFSLFSFLQFNESQTDAKQLKTSFHITNNRS